MLKDLLLWECRPMRSVMEAVQLNNGLAIKLSIAVRLMTAVSFEIYVGHFKSSAHCTFSL